MANMVKRGKIMKKLGVLLFGASLFLTGCANGIEVNKDDALEVALDAAGYVESEVSNTSVKEENGGFHITFTSDEGEFDFVIGSDGIIESRQFTMNKKSENNASSESESKPEAQETVSNEEKTDEVDESGTVGSDVALQNALLNAGLAETDVADVNVTLSQDRTTFTVEFNYNGYVNVSTVDAVTGTVLSTQIG